MRSLLQRLSALLLALTALAAAVSAHAAPRVAVVILLQPATLDDWRTAPAPNLHRLMALGACGLMNTRAARIPGDQSRESVTSAALTLGSGARAACDARDGVFTPAICVVSPGVSAGKLFERRTETPSTPEDLVALGWPRVLRSNQGVGYRVAPGSLGEALERAGAHVCATSGATAPLVASNAMGVVTAFSPDAFLSAAPRMGAAAFIDGPADWTAADQLIGKATRYAAQYNARLIVLSPAVNDREYADGKRLTPIVVYGSDIAPSVLTSRSTRTPGLIANTDFAPTLAADFGAPLPGAGPAQTWIRLPNAHALRILANIERKSWEQRQGMKALPPFAVIAGLLICLASFLLMRGVQVAPIIVLFPAAAIGAFAIGQSVFSLALWFVILLTGTAIGLRTFGAAFTLRGLCAFIWCAAVLHMFAPHGLLKYSLLGYSVIEGARYYGIGNEMMGALAGAVLVAASGAESVWGRRAVFLLVMATAGMAGWPQVGAKAGGVIVSAGTLLVYFGALRGVRWGAGKAVMVVAVSLAAVLAVALADSHLTPGRQSHLGQAVTGLRHGGAGEWADIAARKLAVEGRLLWRSAWAVPLWGAVAGIWTMRRAADDMKSTTTRAVRQAGVAAILLSVAFNDAGAVAGALCGMLLWAYLSLTTMARAVDPRSTARAKQSV